MCQIWLLGTVGIARGDPDSWQKTSQVTFSQSNQSPEQVLPSIIHAERKHIVFTRITNYVRSTPAPSSPSFPLFRTSDCNAPKWLPSALQRRQSQLGVNSGDGSIQKPQNEAFCKVKDWCPRCLSGRRRAWLRPALCWPITGSLQGPALVTGGLNGGQDDTREIHRNVIIHEDMVT